MFYGSTISSSVCIQASKYPFSFDFYRVKTCDVVSVIAVCWATCMLQLSVVMLRLARENPVEPARTADLFSACFVLTCSNFKKYINDVSKDAYVV